MRMTLASSFVVGSVDVSGFGGELCLHERGNTERHGQKEAPKKRP